jgi:hypothetical protein
MTVRLNGRLQGPALTICEQIVYEFGPKPPPTLPSHGKRLSCRDAWDAKDIVEHEARKLLETLVMGQERKGIERYGAPIDHHNDARDFTAEALEEMADALVYLTAQRRRLEGRKRTDERAAHAYNVVQSVRRAIAKAMVELLSERVEP